MFSWRITKYNPDYRDELGRYKKSEWTSFSDVGSIFEGHKLTESEYLAVEDAYVDTIVAFMDCAKISSLKIIGLEKRRVAKTFQESYSTEMNNLYASVQDRDVLNIRETQFLTRMVLREDLWCKFESRGRMFVHFGYDYYMYIGCRTSCEDAIKKTIKRGLFVEKYESPYA